MTTPSDLPPDDRHTAPGSRADRPDPDAFTQSLRVSLEAWEEEVAAYWDELTRSPEFLTRIGRQLSRTFESQQRIGTFLQNAVFNAAVSQQQGARELYLLERLSRQVTQLTQRVDQLEAQLHDKRAR